MAAKVVALFLIAAVVVDAKALDGAKTHASKPKNDKAAPAAAAPSTDGGSWSATAAKCARNREATTPLGSLPTFPAPLPCRSTKKSSPFTFIASMADDQKKVFKEVRQPAFPRRPRFPCVYACAIGPHPHPPGRRCLHHRRPRRHPRHRRHHHRHPHRRHPRRHHRRRLRR